MDITNDYEERNNMKEKIIFKKNPHIDNNFKLKLLSKVISRITNSKYFMIFPYKIEFHSYLKKYLDIYYKIGVKNICNYPSNIKHNIFLLFNKIINLWFDCSFNKNIITVDKMETCCICLGNFDSNEEIIACQNILNKNINNHCYHFECYKKLYNSIWDDDDNDDYSNYNLNNKINPILIEENKELLQNLLDTNLKVKKEYTNCMEIIVKKINVFVVQKHLQIN